MIKKNFLLVFIFCIFAFGIVAQEDEVVEEKRELVQEQADKKNGVKFTTKFNFVVTYPLQVLTGVTEEFKIPVMNFDNPLTKDNNITFKLGMDLSPVTIDGKFGIVWTPVAFLEFYIESAIGSGWKIRLGNDILGIGLNENDGGKSKRVPLNFNRAVFSTSIGGAFQFDLAAVIPNDWLHIVFRTDQFATYKMMTAVALDTSWIHKDDWGKNRNGWKYEATYVIGYKMPIPLDMIAMRIETQKKFFPAPKGLNPKDWGEDLTVTTFGPILNFNIKENYNILLLAQWKAKPAYSNYTDEAFYQTLIPTNPKKMKVKFYQVGLIFHMKFNH